MPSRVSIGFILLMCTLVLMKNGIQIGIYIHFKINQEQIALTNCENQEIPSCLGTCQYKKVLSKHLPSKKSAPALPHPIEQFQWWIISTVSNIDIIKIEPFTERLFSDYIPLIVYDKWQKRVFRPPIS